MTEKQASYYKIKGVFENIDVKKTSEELEKAEERIHDDSLKLNKKVNAVIGIRKMLQMELVVFFYNIVLNSEKYDDIRNRFYLDKDVLNMVMQAYYEDIFRFQLYSQSKHTNTEKRCGYFIKWFSKIKPIQIVEKNEKNTVQLDDNQKDIMTRVNSEIAIILGGMFVFHEQKINILRFFNEDEDFYNELIYAITFRNISSKHISSVIHVLLKSDSKIEKEKIIEQIRNYN